MGQRRRGAQSVTAVACAVAALTAVACDDTTPRTGVVVTMFGTLSDSDVDDVAASVVEFERATGIGVRYIGSSNFEADLLERLRRGDPPDLALLPQPGLLDTLVEEGPRCHGAMSSPGLPSPV